MGMLVLVFRGSTQETQNMRQLADLLKANLPGNTNIPVLMVWEDVNGQVWYECVAACDKDKVSQSDMSRIACSMMGYDPSKCNAQDAEAASATSTSSAMSNKPAVANPPPPSQISCGHPHVGTILICAEGLRIPSSYP